MNYTFSAFNFLDFVVELFLVRIITNWTEELERKSHLKMLASEEGKSDTTNIELIKQDLTSMFETPGINLLN